MEQNAEKLRLRVALPVLVQQYREYLLNERLALEQVALEEGPVVDVDCEH